MFVFYFLSLFTATFIFWRKVKEEHFDDYQLFDYFLSSLLISWILARLGFIMLHFNQFAFNILNWLDVFAKPGFSLFLLSFFWGIFLYRFAKKNTNDCFAILDFWVTAIAGAAVWIFLGWLITGTHLGNQTSLPIGIQFSELFHKYHPTQAYSAVFYLFLLFYLSKLEYIYRTFSWYKGGKGCAQSGFLLGVFVICSGFWWVAICFLKPAEIILGQTSIDIFLAIATIMLGVILLIARSGKFLKSTHEKSPEKLLL